MFHVLILGLSAWLVMAVWVNLPLIPAGLVPAESWGWPLVLLGAVCGYYLAFFADVTIRTRLAGIAAGLVALVALALALRLWLVPLLPEAHPLALVGVREFLVIFGVIYGAYAIAFARGARARDREHLT